MEKINHEVWTPFGIACHHTYIAFRFNRTDEWNDELRKKMDKVDSKIKQMMYKSKIYYRIHVFKPSLLRGGPYDRT